MLLLCDAECIAAGSGLEGATDGIQCAFAAGVAGAVLVVDDDSLFLSELQRSLASHGIAIDTARDAEAATVMLEANEYCGLILDLVLASGSGFDLVQRINDRHRGVPLVLVGQRMPSYVRQMLPEEQVKLVFPEQTDSRTLGSIVLGLYGITA